KTQDPINQQKRASEIIRANAMGDILPGSGEDVQQWRQRLRERQHPRWIIGVSRNQLREVFNSSPSSFPQGHPLIQPSIFPQAINPVSPGTPVLLPLPCSQWIRVNPIEVGGES